MLDEKLNKHDCYIRYLYKNSHSIYEDDEKVEDALCHFFRVGNKGVLSRKNSEH